MRCLSCHYDLRKLAEHRCPECGREFDPNDPLTFEIETATPEMLERDRRARLKIAIALGVCLSVFSIGGLLSRHRATQESASLYLFAGLLAVIVSYLLLRLKRK